uniref:Uncharacterized protein n=1 Tax=Oryza barthii TaxID=65489 RepID=A0A0D3FT64_9ORYZ
MALVLYNYSFTFRIPNLKILGPPLGERHPRGQAWAPGCGWASNHQPQCGQAASGGASVVPQACA